MSRNTTLGQGDDLLLFHVNSDFRLGVAGDDRSGKSRRDALFLVLGCYPRQALRRSDLLLMSGTPLLLTHRQQYEGQQQPDVQQEKGDPEKGRCKRGFHAGE